MMGSQIIPSFSIIFIIISIILSDSNASLCQQTIEYIDGRLRNSKVEIAKYYIQDPDSVTTITYDIKWDPLWTHDSCTHALTMGFPNKLFILMESDRAMSIDVDLPADPFPSTISLHKVSILRSGTPMKFLRSITFKETIYLLICYSSDFCNIYTSPGTPEFTHHQKTRLSTPVDATFFTDNDQLFLIISTRFDHHSSPSVIYRWTGTYMDIITTIHLKSVTSVVTFSHKSSRFFVFSQSFIGSQVHKLIIDESSGHGHLEVTQYLQTNQPVGMHLYPHNGCTFLLVVNQAEPSQVFWWDGTEFLPWMQVEDIQGFSPLSSLKMGNETFFFVAHNNLLTSYRVRSLGYEQLDSFEIPDVVRIIDLGVWIDGANISVVLVSEKGRNCYRVEPLQLFVSKLKKGEAEGIEDESDGSEICLKRLMEKLKKRMGEVEESRASWESLHSASGDAVLDTLEADVVLRSSTSIQTLEIINNSTEEIIAPEELRVLMKDLESKILKSLNKSQNLITTKTMVLPSLKIINEANFDDLETLSLETKTINNVDLHEHLQKAISATNDQVFEGILRGHNVMIHNLEVESLCGVPRDFWLLKNESKKTPLKPISGPADLQVQIEINNDTVFMTSDIFLPKFETHLLNSVDLKDLFDNLFIVGQNQVINGAVVFQHLIVDDLVLEKLNGAPVDQLLTITTDQYLNHSVSIDSLDVHHLHVTKINGISLSEAAKLSEENVIKGKVVVGHLRITDELIVDDDCDLFKKAEQVQVYDDVTIIGSVTIRKLQLENQADVQLEGLKIHGNDIERLFVKSWTKSSDQVINSTVLTFKNGLTIDELNTEYLNGVRKDEYLYTTVENINSEYGKIHFEEIFVNGSLRHGNQTKDFIEITDDSLVFNENIFFEELNASNVITSRYNGIPIYMMNDEDSEASIPVSLPDDLKLDQIFVNNHLQVTDIHLKTLNNRNVSKFLFVDQNHKLENVKTSEFRVSEFRSSSSSKVPRAASEFIPPEAMDITIQGPLIVEDDLSIEKSINDQDVQVYLDHLSKTDIRVNDPDLILEELIVLEDGIIFSLQNVDFDKLIQKIFYKSKDQTLNGTKSFHRVTADAVQAEVINGKQIEEMYLVNDSLVFEEDVIFTNLSADVEALIVNDVDTKWIQKDVSYISSKNISQMNLTGTVTWENSESPRILSDIIKNAVNISNSGIFEAPVDFSDVEIVQISSLQTDKSSFSNIEAVIKDAVLDDNSVIEFSGIKTFLRDLEVSELIVDDLEINRLEKTTMRDLNASIFRKFEDIKTIEGTCTFTDETSMTHLETGDLGPGMPDISSLFISSNDHNLPNGTHFNHLIIKTAEVSSLDGVNFGQFLKERITLTGDHVIQSKVRFNGHIQVLGDVQVETINGVLPSDIVLKDSAGPQVVKGFKTFSEYLIVEENVRAPLFNSVNIIDAYNNGVLNEESAVIKGNLIIEGSINLKQDTKVSGTINGLKLSSFLQDYEDTSDETLETIERNLTAITSLITNATKIAGHLPKLLHHFELQQQLETPHIKTVSKIIPVVIDKTTRLNVYGTKSGVYCAGLPEDCPCRSQYIIEASENQFVSKREDDLIVVFNFQEIHNLFTISISTTSISSSFRCSLTGQIDEFTAITWMATNNSRDFSHHEEKILGYLSDVQVFVHGETAYIVLVMSYDAEKKTHEVDSLIYKLNLERNKLELVMRVPVVGASAVEVFRIPGRGAHVMISAGGLGDLQETAKSLLYRIKSNGSEFEVLRSFYSGGTRNIQSLAFKEQDFLILDDVKMNSVQIYRYKESFDNFYIYQNLYFECAVRNIEVFYAGEVRWSDAYLVVTVEDGRVFLYQYMMLGRFQERMSKWVGGALAVRHFRVHEERYLLVSRMDNSSVYRIVLDGVD